MKLLIFSLCLLVRYVNSQTLSYVIDDFSCAYITQGEVQVRATDLISPIIDNGYFDTLTPGCIMGMQRDCLVEAWAVNSVDSFGFAGMTSQNTMAASSDQNVLPNYSFQWDGQDNDPVNVNPSPTSLANFLAVCPEVTANPYITIRVHDSDKCHFETVVVYSEGQLPAASTKEAGIFIPNQPCFKQSGNAISLDFFFTEFVGANFADIRAIEALIDTREQGVAAIDVVWDFVGVCCCKENADCDDLDPVTDDSCDGCSCSHSSTDPPTNEPTVDPTAAPTVPPSADPTAEPTADPTAAPTLVPTVDPTASPTQVCNNNLCEEEAKTAICFADADGNYNRICAKINDLQTYWDNGGFDPNFNEEFDCDCRLINPPTEPPPTFAPTQPPTQSPTDPPTDQPTQFPSEPPTEAPTDASLGEIGEFVFYDEDGNGIKDIGEDGIFGAVVHLFDDVDNNGVYSAGDTWIISDTTDNNGWYLFNGLSAGDYVVVLDDPNGVLPSVRTTNVLTGAGGTLAGDYPTAIGEAGVTGLTWDDVDHTYNFGFDDPPTPPPESCQDAVPGQPGYNFRCIMDGNYNVDMAIVNLVDPIVATYEMAIPLGSTFDTFGIQLPVFWDCWCHAQCPWPDSHDHMAKPEFLYDHSWFYGDNLHLVVAIPDKFNLGTQFSFQDAEQNLIPVGACASTEDLGACPDWTMAEESNSTDAYFRHHCYTAYYVDIPLSSLTTFYETHVDGSSADANAWMVTYYGLLVSESGYDQGVDARGFPLIYTQRANYRWGITFPLQVEHHLEDIRIYDEVNKLDNVVGSSVFVEDFAWGFSWGMYELWGEVEIRTSVQWPFRLDVVSHGARDNVDITTFFWDQDDILCVDPGVTDFQSGPMQPACVQFYTFRLERLADTVCTFDDYYDIEFAVSCQPSYADNCPLDERYSAPLNCEFWLTTENFCDEFNEVITVSATIESYECPERTCACQENNFIENFAAGGDETVYFELVVDSDEPLLASEVNRVETDIICEGLSDIMHTVYDRNGPGDGWHPSLSGVVNDYPLTAGQCGGGETANTVEFEFDLPQDFFEVPIDDSCNLHIWVVVDLFYAGVARPDGLVPALTPASKLLLEDADEITTFTFGEGRSITISSELLLTAEVENTHAMPADDNDVEDQHQEQGTGSAAQISLFVTFVIMSLVVGIMW